VIRAKIATTLPLPAEDLFDFLADVRNESRWHPDYRSAE
jgi:hypothetical protein